MTNLTFEQVKDIRRHYLAGMRISDIARKFSVAPSTVTKYINDEGLGKLAVPKEYRAVYKESKVPLDVLNDAKVRAIDFIQSAIDEAYEKPNKILFIDKVTSALNTIDRIHRLDRGEVTDRTETIDKKIDYAEIIKELKTPEDKLRFLKKQLIKKKNDDKN